MNAADFPSITLAEALGRLAEMPRVLEAALAGASRADLELRPDAQSFCLVEHACHLRDLEREGYATRLSRMLDEEHPVLAEFHGDVVARERGYMAQDARAAAAAFASARADVIARARQLGAAQMARTGVFGGRTITVRDLLAMMVEHDAAHRDEIANLVGLRAAS